MRVRDLKIIAAIVGVFLLVEPVFPQTQGPDLRHLLSAQGFSGLLGAKDGVTFTELGQMTCGSKSLRVVYYRWKDPHPPSTPHESYRIIFIEGDVYLGSYQGVYLYGKPLVGPNLILFPPQGEEGNRIECKAGKLPQRVLLGGDYAELGK